MVRTPRLRMVAGVAGAAPPRRRAAAAPAAMRIFVVMPRLSAGAPTRGPRHPHATLTVAVSRVEIRAGVSYNPHMTEFRLLGPLEVLADDGSPLPLGGQKQRAVLALLLLRANRVVATDFLVDTLWGENPPR